jgi:nucleotide-binding universal stress UspA family protein
MLVAVGSERTKPVVDLAFDLAQRSHHELHLLHVLTPTWGEMDDDLQSDVAEGVRRKLLSLLPSQPEVEVRLHVATGLPAAEIVRVAREIRARFAVLGSYRRDATTFERSICRDVLHHSRCPVWLVPPPTGQPATTGPSREIRH